MPEFTRYRVFNHPKLGYQGNTSDVCLIENDIQSDELQKIATQRNQPATTFLWNEGKGTFKVRWFAPDAEIGVCGHGAAAALAFIKDKYEQHEPVLLYNIGEISGVKTEEENRISFDIEVIPVIKQLQNNKALENALGIRVKEHHLTENKNIVVVESEETLRSMRPDFEALAKLPDFGYIVTSKGRECDVVSRTLVPKVQQLEDHATGSSHAAIIPFWANRLGKNKLICHQLSQNGGYFEGEVFDEETVNLTGFYEKIG
jgi:PhzF family phenazine biosynthesis protein